MRFSLIFYKSLVIENQDSLYDICHDKYGRDDVTSRQPVPENHKVIENIEKSERSIGHDPTVETMLHTNTLRIAKHCTPS